MNAYDAVVVGSGPAGMSAAIYLGRAGINAVVVGSRAKSRAYGDYAIDNYFGLTSSSAKSMMDSGHAQAVHFGAKFLDEEVTKAKAGTPFTLATSSGKEIVARALIIATGIKPPLPSVPDERKYKGRGVSECVSCDGFAFRNKDVIVVGEGNHAAQEALDLLDYTRKVRIFTNGRKPAIGASMSERLGKEGIPVIEKKITALVGEPMLRAFITDGGEEPVDGVFLGAGATSPVDLALALGLELDGNSIRVDRGCRTNVKGVFAAGDCTGGIMQMAQAVGDGATAALGVIRFLKEATE